MKIGFRFNPLINLSYQKCWNNKGSNTDRNMIIDINMIVLTLDSIVMIIVIYFIKCNK